MVISFLPYIKSRQTGGPRLHSELTHPKTDTAEKLVNHIVCFHREYLDYEGPKRKRGKSADEPGLSQFPEIEQVLFAIIEDAEKRRHIVAGSYIKQVAGELAEQLGLVFEITGFYSKTI